jgi:predicted nucleic acid-binding protein
MRIVVSDSSCLIDLRKTGLLAVFLRLPYEIIIPDTLFHEELLRFSPADKQALLDGGLKVRELPGEGVARAQKLATALPHISIHDAFAFALAERNPGCILLSGDAKLRVLASSFDFEVHGILWVIDELHRCGLRPPRALFDALKHFAADPTVRLPQNELAAYLRRYESL